MKLQFPITTAFSAAAWASCGVDEATQFTLTYGYPLMPFAHFAIPVLEGVKATNHFLHMKELATSSFKSVVRPNVDTLYSSAVLDLSRHDVVVDVPVVKGRYWVFPFYDAYGNNYVNLGSVTDSKAGKYVLRYDADEKPGVHLCGEKLSLPKCEKGVQGFINAPTPYGIIVVRYAVTDAPGDLQQIHTLQKQTTMHAIGKSMTDSITTAPPLTMDMLNSSLSSDPATKIMQLTARIAPHNPPREISDLGRVDLMLKRAGIHQDGTYEQPRGVNLTAAYVASETAMFNAPTKPGNTHVLGNGWSEISAAAQGDYGKNYEMRAYVAYFGYLALTAEQALYPSHSAGGDGPLHLGPKQAFIFTFPSKPPLEQYGFWSLTAYTAAQYLVPNALDRYALSDRSKITYADGSLVYDGRPSARKDRTFDLLVQPADVAPPRNWTSNWLPAPKGGGDLSLTLRFYAPTKQLHDGSWLYPVVRKIDAIVA